MQSTHRFVLYSLLSWNLTDFFALRRESCNCLRSDGRSLWRMDPPSVKLILRASDQSDNLNVFAGPSDAKVTVSNSTVGNTYDQANVCANHDKAYLYLKSNCTVSTDVTVTFTESDYNGPICVTLAGHHLSGKTPSSFSQIWYFECTIFTLERSIGQCSSQIQFGRI